MTTAALTEPMRALLKAGARHGLPTVALTELMRELRRDGWALVRDDHGDPLARLQRINAEVGAVRRQLDAADRLSVDLGVAFEDAQAELRRALDGWSA